MKLPFAKEGTFMTNRPSTITKNLSLLCCCCCYLFTIYFLFVFCCCVALCSLLSSSLSVSRPQTRFQNDKVCGVWSLHLFVSVAQTPSSYTHVSDTRSHTQFEIARNETPKRKFQFAESMVNGLASCCLFEFLFFYFSLFNVRVYVRARPSRVYDVATMSNNNQKYL